jgi:prostamide/prostaglandin F2alpha synthase
MADVLGTSKEKQRTHPPADARELADLELTDLDGRKVRLGEVWSEHPAVVVFLRHYG